MPFFVKLPDRPTPEREALVVERYVNIINGGSTVGQRELRRMGYAGYEPATAATICALMQLLEEGTFGGRSSAGERPVSFFDVGANAGHYSLLVMGRWPEARVVAFEPHPVTYAWLRRLLESNRMSARAEQLAVAAEDGEAKLHLSGWSDAYHSLNDALRDRDGSVDVRTVSLDGFCAEADTWPDLLKLSVESREDAVLTGAMRLLKERRPFVVLEMHPDAPEGAEETITRLVRECSDYHLYPIVDEAELQPQDAVARTDDRRDWLMSPVVLDRSFSEARVAWREAISRCTAATNVVSNEASQALERAEHARAAGDEEEALARYEEAAALGAGRAFYFLGRAAEDTGRYDVSLAHYRDGAAHDEPAAIRGVARAYELGRGVPKSRAEERRWLLRAVALGDRRACVRLADVVAEDEGMQSALRWYERAAQLGAHKAYYNLGRHFEDAKDYARSFGYYQAGDKLDEPACTRGLARAYELGRGVAVDEAEAMRLLEKGVALGDGRAAMKLAELVANAKGREEALRWWETAIELGMPKAYYHLARYYEDAKRFDLSFGYHSKGANEGVAACIRGVARAYELGRGVAKDAALSRQWAEREKSARR